MNAPSRKVKEDMRTLLKWDQLQRRSKKAQGPLAKIQIHTVKQFTLFFYVVPNTWPQTTLGIKHQKQIIKSNFPDFTYLKSKEILNRGFQKLMNR